MDTLTTGFLFVFVIVVFLCALMFSGFIGWLIFCLVDWCKREVTQEEYTSFKSEQQDWIAKRMNK